MTMRRVFASVVNTSRWRHAAATRFTILSSTPDKIYEPGRTRARISSFSRQHDGPITQSYDGDKMRVFISRIAIPDDAAFDVES
jgi:hypothetical protein